jgi:hypothetical protein
LFDDDDNGNIRHLTNLYDEARRAKAIKPGNYSLFPVHAEFLLLLLCLWGPLCIFFQGLLGTIFLGVK